MEDATNQIKPKEEEMTMKEPEDEAEKKVTLDKNSFNFQISPENKDDDKIKCIKEEEIANEKTDRECVFSCDICSKHYKTGQALKRHKTIHTSDKNCPTCGKTFYSKKVMNVHMRKVHLKDFRYSCSECDYKTDDRTVFDIHLRTHTGEKPNKCQYCEKSFNDPSSLIYHTKLAHTKQGVKACESCGKEFLGKSQLNRHLITHVRGQKKGPVEYSSEFKSLAVKEAAEIGAFATAMKHGIGPSALRRWIKLAKDSALTTESATTEMKCCEICGKEFSSQSRLHIHQLIHDRGEREGPRNYSNEFKLKALLEAQQIGVIGAAKKLGVSYGTLREWKRLVKYPKKVSKCCEICGKEMSSKGDLKRHLLAHAKGMERPKVSEYSNEFKDEVTKYALDNGTRKTVEKFGISSSSIQKWLKIRKDPLPCNQCSEVFGYKHHLDQHIRSYHGDRKYNVNEESFSNYVLMNNIGEQLKKALPPNPLQKEDNNMENDIKVELDNDVTEDMENAMEGFLHYFNPEILVTEEVMDKEK